MRVGVLGLVLAGIGRVVWVLEVGEGVPEDVCEGGTFRFELLLVSVSVSSVLSFSDAFFWRDALIAVSLVTASLICAGTRTQAKVRS